MPRELRVAHTDSFPTTVERAFDTVLAEPLQNIFAKRFVAIPPIKEARDQDGPWGTPGQTRTIVLADGGTMREQLTEVRRPDRFGYLITEVTGPMKPLVASVEGRWSFSAEGERTRVTWEWTVRPQRFAGAAMPVFAWLWRGNARNAFAEIRRLLG